MDTDMLTYYTVEYTDTDTKESIKIKMPDYCFNNERLLTGKEKYDYNRFVTGRILSRKIIATHNIERTVKETIIKH